MSQTRQDQVLEAIETWGPSTCEEIEKLTLMSHQSCSAAIYNLVKQGYLTRGPDQRPTDSGKMADIIRIASGVVTAYGKPIAAE